MSELTRGIYDIIADEVTPITDNGGSITVDGTVAISNPSIPVTDNGGSLTIDGNIGIVEKTILFATGTVSASGDSTIIAAPGSNLTIKISVIEIQNESAVATTAILKFNTTAKWRTLMQKQGDGILIPIPSGRAWPVGNNAPLVLNLSGANAVGYSIAYYVEAP